ncbi:MAG TPA: glycosyltransferase family 4 protein [Acidimicrobiales bacterium]|nr:glycosyltransferase family 4 protein [Acidimicrobiales bacterium]
MTVLLVANDFPPKHGGIQSYLWELARRQPAGELVVMTTPHPDATAFDAAQPFRVERVKEGVMWPTPALARRINGLARDAGARLVVLDPPIPLGLLHGRLDLPYAVILHGGVVGQARPPVARQLLARVLRGAVHIVTAGGFPAAEARRAAGDSLPPVTVVAPGIDVDRFHPLDDEARAAARARFGIPTDARVVANVNRLVPRKGFDVLLEAGARLATTRPDLVLAFGGAGRDRQRLDKLAARTGAPVRMLGRIPDDDLPAFHAMADVFATPCRNRWGGLEQEGFGVVFLEAAASGVPQVAGASGGAHEAVEDGVTGLVVDRPRDPAAVARAIAKLLDDADLRRRMGAAARGRAVAEFSWDGQAAKFTGALAGVGR